MFCTAQRPGLSGPGIVCRIKLVYHSACVGHTGGLSHGVKQKYSWSSVPGEWDKNGETGSWDPLTAGQEVASAANWTLLSLTQVSCSPGGTGKEKPLLWAPLPQGLFLESPSPSQSPSARTSPDNERPPAPPYRWQWNQ